MSDFITMREVFENMTEQDMKRAEQEKYCTKQDKPAQQSDLNRLVAHYDNRKS